VIFVSDHYYPCLK